MKTLIVVDCQNDFISGTLACDNSENALKDIVKLINKNKYDVVYSCDWHSSENSSFKAYGGIWPPHCVQNTWGAELSTEFKNIQDSDDAPNENNIYKKGLNDHVEEYSAYYAKNKEGKSISDIDSEEFLLVGIASEYCVRETALELLKNNKKVSIYTPGLAYVDYKDHLKSLKDLQSKGVELLEEIK